MNAPKIGALALWLAVPVPAAPAQEASSLVLPVVRWQLANGLDVIVAPDSAATEVSIELWMDSGGRDEPPGRFGMAHFFEHAMPFGDGVIRSRLGRRLFDSLRIDGNAKTRFDYTRYYLKTRPEGLDYFLLITADRLRADPIRELTASRVEAHRQNVAAEIRRQATGTWGWPVKYALHAGTFGVEFPYGHHLYGSEPETRDVSSDDLVRWFHANVRPEHAMLLVVGRFDTAAVRTAIERDFGSIAGGPRPSRRALTSLPHTRSSDTVSIETNRNFVLIDWPVLRWQSDETPALILLQHALSDRLSHSRPNFIKDASAELELWQLSGRFGLMAAFEAESDSKRAEGWLRSQLQRVQREGLTDAELASARDAELASITKELSRLGWEESRTELIGEGVMFADDPMAYARMLQRERSVSTALVRDIASERLGHPGFSLFVRGRVAPGKG
jgi:zinc protease